VVWSHYFRHRIQIFGQKKSSFRQKSNPNFQNFETNYIGKKNRGRAAQPRKKRTRFLLLFSGMCLHMTAYEIIVAQIILAYIKSLKQILP
jgi:hypothetical protein